MYSSLSGIRLLTAYQRRLALLIIALLCISLPRSACQEVSSAGLGQEFNTSGLTGGSSSNALQSSTGNFVLSFYNEGEAFPAFYTLVISTYGDALLISSGDIAGQFVSTSIWSANAGQQIKNNCSLLLQQDGNLVLQDFNLTLYWQTNTSDKGVVSMALLDDGNLVLLDAENRTVWQSFDHPSDTLVLGQRLTAGASMLTQGPYSLGLFNTGLYLLYGSTERLPYWQLYPDTNSSGTLSPSTQALGAVEVERNVMQFFALSNSSALIGSIDFPAFTNTSVSDHSWWLLQLSATGFLEGFRANSSQYQSSFSLPATMPPCSAPDFCSQFYGGLYYVCSQGSGDCSSCPLVLPPDRSTLNETCTSSSIPAYPDCSTEEDISAHQFLNLTGYTYFALAFNVSTLSASAEDCADGCMRNCSCKAAFYVSSNSSCLHVSEVSNLINVTGNRTDHLAFIKYQQQVESLDPSPSPISVPGVLPDGRSTATGKIIGAVIGTVVSLLVVTGFCFFWIKKRKGKGANEDDEKDDEEVFLGTLPGLPPRFTLKELTACTNNFSRKLGAGGFGVVYEGVNPRDKEKWVAVKRLDFGPARHGNRQFQAEIATIGSMRHVNLVRLEGFCMEGRHRMLVYELMTNGSLNAYLRKPGVPGSDHANRELLLWKTRLGIVLGTARGLAYLHDECRERIIHCDIKPENILLNHRLEAVISDFGLAKLMSRDQSYAATTLRGTWGYVAPERIRHAPITEKSDVYSYGMVLLELVSGRRLLDVNTAISERQFLPDWARSLDLSHDEGRTAFREFIDERLLTGMKEDVWEVENAARQVVAIALLCIQEDPNARPSMVTVIRMLEGDVEVPAIPRSTHKAVLSHVSSFSSVNRLTMSEVSAR